MKIKEGIKTFWNWLWNSNSFFSYLTFLVFVYVLIKFIFLPLLGITFGSAMPLAIVESSSMDHEFLKYCESFDSSKDKCMLWSEEYELCGKKITEAKSINFDEYWDNCGDWYKRNTEITIADFEEFNLKNGFKKGDILVLIGWREPKIGDVILFKPSGNSNAPRPIIHRAVNENPIQTKGDHNEGQLKSGNNVYNTDETSISREEIIGIAVAKIPYLGWGKLIFVELWKMFS